MRVVALLVVLCGCRVGASSAPLDANTPRGDGLAERVTTDAALWADLRPVDATGSGRDSKDDGMGQDGSAAGDAAGDTTATPCRLLEASCKTLEACYPFPYEGTPSGQTKCAIRGDGHRLTLCQSQLVCDSNSVCVTPGEPDAVCLERCDLNGPNCPPGTACLPLAGYAGVGYCSL